MKTRLRVVLGEKRNLALGGLEFDVLRREIGDDGGTSIEVYGEVAGSGRTQVLRFDCFRRSPHYHMPPSAPGQLPIDTASVGDPLEWTLACVRERLPEMIRKAGYADLVPKIDAAALRTGAERLREIAARAPEPDPSTAREVEIELPPVSPR